MTFREQPFLQLFAAGPQFCNLSQKMVLQSMFRTVVLQTQKVPW